jgi:hypothetical protein
MQAVERRKRLEYNEKRSKKGEEEDRRMMT